jgi:hypothetical protein
VDASARVRTLVAISADFLVVTDTTVARDRFIAITPNGKASGDLSQNDDVGHRATIAHEKSKILQFA